MKEYLVNLFAQAAEKLSYLKNVELQFNVPQETAHGDLSTNIAMLLTKELKKNPRAIADEIISNLPLDENIISKVQVAGPGFINFYFTPGFVNAIINKIIQQNDRYGFSNEFSGKKANVEFASLANPTCIHNIVENESHGQGS